MDWLDDEDHHRKNWIYAIINILDMPTTIKEIEFLSHCCGAESIEPADGPTSIEEGKCPDCKEPCRWEKYVGSRYGPTFYRLTPTQWEMVRIIEGDSINWEYYKSENVPDPDLFNGDVDIDSTQWLEALENLKKNINQLPYD